VPGVDQELEGEESGERSAHDAEPRAVDEAVRRHPLDGQDERDDRGERCEHHQEADADPLPAAARRKGARGAEVLGQGEHGVGDERQQPDDIDDVHGVSLCGRSGGGGPYGVSLRCGV
jgi:hypothetical protein